MSLHALAGHMAAKGRGSDSMLVHMTPEEVQSLQVLALRAGGTLTINPETGLPEANFLKKMLPMIAGFALGPAGFGLMSAGMAGATIGGITALSTGSLSRGLMAGLGAYGGASLGGGLETLGSTAVAPEALAAANASADPIMSLTAAKEAATAAGIAPAAGAEAAKQGLAMAANNPKSFITAMGGPAKAIGAAYAAASPLMAADTVQTTTPRQDTGYIRQKKFNPYTQQFIELEPVKASEWGSRRFSDYAGGGIVALAEGGRPNVKEFMDATGSDFQTASDMLYGVVGSNRDTRDWGAIMAAADPVAAARQATGSMYGGVTQGTYTAPDRSTMPALFSSDGRLLTTGVDRATNFGLAAALPQAAAQAATTQTAAPTSGYTPFTSSQIHDYIVNNNLDAAGIAAATARFNADPNAVANVQNAQELVSNVYRNVLGRDPDPVGLQYWTNQVTSGARTGQEMYQEFLGTAQDLLAKSGETGLLRSGISLEDAVKPFTGYSSADKRNVADEWIRNTLGREVTDADRAQQWYKDATSASAMNTYDAARRIFGEFQNYATRTGKSQADALAEARATLAGMGLTEADVLAQTGKTLSELVRGSNLGLGLFQASQLQAPGSIFDFSSLQARKPVIPPVVVTEATDLPGGVSGGGNTVVNSNGTVTTTPNIPGRPAGGFTGMGQVRDVYTQGGGSLGQSNLFVPKTLADMYARYGNTGGSQQAYDYLMGKGAADIKKPVTKTGELMLPYAQSVLGQEIAAASGPATQKYLFDRRTRRYILNPAYVDPNAPKSQGTTTTTAPDSGDGSVGAANGGVMRMALGGLGALAAGGAASQYNLGSYSDGGRLLRGPGDGVSDSIPATIGGKQPARLADGEFVVPARIVSELGNGSTEAGARKLYAMMDRVQKARGKTTGKNRVAANTRADKYLPA